MLLSFVTLYIDMYKQVTGKTDQEIVQLSVQGEQMSSSTDENSDSDSEESSSRKRRLPIKRKCVNDASDSDWDSDEDNSDCDVIVESDSSDDDNARFPAFKSVNKFEDSPFMNQIREVFAADYCCLDNKKQLCDILRSNASRNRASLLAGIHALLVWVEECSSQQGELLWAQSGNTAQLWYQLVLLCNIVKIQTRRKNAVGSQLANIGSYLARYTEPPSVLDEFELYEDKFSRHFDTQSCESRVVCDTLREEMEALLAKKMDAGTQGSFIFVVVFNFIFHVYVFFMCTLLYYCNKL